MASEEWEPVQTEVPGEVERWLERAAAEREMDVDTYVREILQVHRAVHERDVDTDPDGETAPDLDDDRVQELRSEFRDLVDDVRERVVQVKRETDQKASADHDHPDLTAELATLQEELQELESAVRDRESELAEVRSDLEGGFENFEDVLEFLLETTDRLEERADTLARATVDVRERVAELAGTVGDRERVAQLKRDASLEGATAAECQDCGSDVQIALLTAPECPFCSASIVDLEPKRGLFGSATLATGDQPALSGSEFEARTEALESTLESDRPDPADVDWDTATGSDE